jgi:hypothetical protein
MVADVALVKAVMGVAGDILQTGSVACIGQAVDIGDAPFRPDSQSMPDEIGPDKTTATGYD